MTRTTSSCKRLPVLDSLAGWMELERKPCSTGRSLLSPIRKEIYSYWILEIVASERLHRMARFQRSRAVEMAGFRATEQMFLFPILVPGLWLLIIPTPCGSRRTPVARLFCCESEVTRTSHKWSQRRSAYSRAFAWIQRTMFMLRIVALELGTESIATERTAFGKCSQAQETADRRMETEYLLPFIIQQLLPLILPITFTSGTLSTISSAESTRIAMSLPSLARRVSHHSLMAWAQTLHSIPSLGCAWTIRKMTSSTNVITMAGSFTQTGYTDGTGSLARFRNAAGVCVSQGMLFVADSNDHRIRNLTFNPAPQPVSGANLDLSIYPGLRITGVVGRSYRIESSLDMTNWNTETTILLTSSPYLWIDPNSLRQKQFYRAFLLP